MGTVTLRDLPKCDICKLLKAPHPKAANADSATKFGHWAYTCESHKNYRVGPVTKLIEEP